ncbi:MAG: hypothetical protein DRQ88_11540 [Epsilonproteobacteria bacterium]|nr:MAG: hypothetical protein DRQ88_11540 [Campylobacterota bacterium]
MQKNNKWISENVKCCACGGKIGSEHINIIQINKKATWSAPAGSIVSNQAGGFGALAVVCDDCIQNNKKLKFAVDWSGDEIKYPSISELDDLEPFFDMGAS